MSTRNFSNPLYQLPSKKTLQEVWGGLKKFQMISPSPPSEILCLVSESLDSWLLFCIAPCIVIALSTIILAFKAITTSFPFFYFLPKIKKSRNDNFTRSNSEEYNITMKNVSTIIIFANAYTLYIASILTAWSHQRVVLSLRI